MKTLVAIGRTSNAAYTMHITHTLPLSPAWLERNRAVVVK